MNWYLSVLKKYSVFEGRACRKEFWMFVLFNMIISMGLALIENSMGMSGMIGGLYSLGVFIPTLAVGTRRLHDTGKTGWWQLIALIPLIGVLVLIFMMAQQGIVGSNEHGEDPMIEKNLFG